MKEILYKSGGCGLTNKCIYVYKPELFHRKEWFEGKSFISITQLTEAAANTIKINKDNIIVIPDRIDFEEIQIFNLTEFEDYIYERFVYKPIVIIYGNCHTEAISDYLMLCPEFCEQYALYRIRPIHTIENSTYFNHPIFKHCDIFIHQSIRLKNRYGEAFASENVIKFLKPECKIISIPNVYQLPECFFPQYLRGNELKSRSGTTLFFRDSILDSYARKGIKWKKAYKLYITEKHFESNDLNKALNDFFEKVELREKDWDIKCLDYIKKNFKQFQLFYDPNHPTEQFIYYLAEEILKFLDIKFDSTLRFAKVRSLSTYEMPILPEVKSYHGMTFEYKTMRLAGNKIKSSDMDIRSYVAQYLSCAWQIDGVSFQYRIMAICNFLILKVGDKLLGLLRKLRK